MLDVVTLMLSGMIISLLFALAQFLVWSAHRNERSLLWWSSGNLVNAASLACFLCFGAGPSLALVVLANTMALATVALFLAGVRVFNGRHAGVTALVTVCGMSIVLVALFYLLVDRQLDRVVIISVVIALICAETAREIHRGDTLLTTFARRVATAFFVFCATIFMVRGAAALIAIFVPAISISMIFDIAFLASFIGVAVGNFCFLFMVFERISLEDDLTKLYNRRGLQVRGSALFRRARAKRRPLTALMFDLDQFKAINDTFGHQVGDHVLREFARLLQRSVGRHGLASRCGGDEFCIILPDCEPEQAWGVAEDIRVMCAATIDTSRMFGAQVTVTIGVATLRPDMKGLDDLLLAADSGLYKAKFGGRNRVGHGLRPVNVDIPNGVVNITAAR